MTGNSQRRNKLALCLAFIALISLSCDSSRKDEKIKAMESRIKIDSTLLASLNFEMDNINNALNEAENLNDYFMNSRSVKKVDAINKIVAMDSILTKSLKKIDSLENALESSSSILKGNKVIENGIFSKKSEVGFAADYYRQLQMNIELLTNQNINLSALIRKKDEEIVERDNVIMEIRAERERQEEKLNELKYQIQMAEQKLAESERRSLSDSKAAIENTAKLYYETGLEFKSIHDNLTALSTLFGAKNSKRSLIVQAYDYFKKSYDLGNYEAKREMDILKSDKKYSKYFE